MDSNNESYQFGKLLHAFVLALSMQQKILEWMFHSAYFHGFKIFALNLYNIILAGFLNKKIEENKVSLASRKLSSSKTLALALKQVSAYDLRLQSRHQQSSSQYAPPADIYILQVEEGCCLQFWSNFLMSVYKVKQINSELFFP